MRIRPASISSLVVARRGRAACDRSDARDELAQPERLDEVVVRAELEPDDSVDLFASRRDDDDRDRRARPQLAADLEAVHVGQPEVEQDDVRLVGGERLLPGRRAHDLEAFAPQALRERDRNRVVVLDEQHIHVLIVAGGGSRRLSNFTHSLPRLAGPGPIVAERGVHLLGSRPTEGGSR